MRRVCDKFAVLFLEVRLMFFDIHSHILPNVDDGAKTIEDSLELLKLLKEQGVTAVLATPHFYPQDDNLSEFTEKCAKAFDSLNNEAKKNELPIILKGSEMLYFKGISESTSLKELCLNNSNFLLLELVDKVITPSLFEEIINLSNNLGIIPIIAHIERYYKAKNYRSFLKFIKEHNILTQVNANAFFIPSYKRVIKKLFKMEIVNFIASDTHSPSFRPPMITDALSFIEEKFGKDIKDKLIANSNNLFTEIFKGETNA